MSLTFNMLLQSEGIDPAEVRLLRHETKKYQRRTPYSLWRDDPAKLERYQSTQARSRRPWFKGRYWASFVVTPDGRTLFTGLYSVGEITAVPPGWWHDLNDQPLDTEADERYDLTLLPVLSQYVGRLSIDWGIGTRSWAQLAGNRDKPIIELSQAFVEPIFPGFPAFFAQLSDLEALPPAWHGVLTNARGVYLLTCPRTREQYVGAATGADDFLGRWRAYVADGHGGNVGLQIHGPSDYRVSVLQVAGSADDRDAVLAMEAIWKAKLQSREMGLNRN